MSGTESEWKSNLARQIHEMGPMTRGRYLPYPDSAEEQVSGEGLLDVGYLRASVTRARPAAAASDNPKDRDPRVAASRMSRQYCAALTCVALTGLANGVGIDLTPARCTVIFRNDLPVCVALRGEPRVLLCRERPTSWPVTGPVVPTLDQLRAHVWTDLYARNLRLLITALVGLVDVPERLLWTNAAEWVATVMDSALEYLEPAAAETVAAECRALLAAETLPGFAGKPNPLRGLLEWIPFDGGVPSHGIQTRHLCCLVYLHTDRHGRLCQNCPLLPLPDRAALVRERRGVGIKNPGGPAEQRCIEVGLGRWRLATRGR